MIRVTWVASLLLLPAIAGGARADDAELKVVVEKAWKGCEVEKLKKVKAWSMTVDAKRLAGLFRGEYTTTEHAQFPNRFRRDLVNSDKKVEVMVVNGENGWQKRDGAVTDMAKAEANRLRPDSGRGTFLLVLALRDPTCTLELLPDSKAGGRATHAIRVTRGQEFPEVLHVDQESGLVVMLQRGLPSARSETLFSDFRKIDGIPIAHARTMRENGTLIEERKLTIKFDEKLDDKLFEKP